MAGLMVAPFVVGKEQVAAFTKDAEVMDEALFANILSMEMEVPTDNADQVKNTYLIIMSALYEIDGWVDRYSTKAADTVLKFFKEARAGLAKHHCVKSTRQTASQLHYCGSHVTTSHGR